MDSPTLVTLLPGLVVLAGALWTVRRILAGRERRLAGVSMQPAADGAVAVPVRAAFAGGGGLLGGWSKNSLRPSMSIAPDGIRVRVMRETFWPFPDIAQVSARKTRSGQLLVFVRVGGREVLSAEPRDAAAAKAALAALPRTVPLTAEAAILRDGTAAAAAPGLRAYRGRAR